MTQAVALAQYGSTGTGLSFKNRIINGAMVINQRGTTSGVTSGYFVDRWALSGCSTSSVLTSSLPTGFSNGISISATSGNPIALQKIESKNCSDLSGQSVTLSFYAQNISNATTLYASLAYANSTDNFGATTTISEQNLGTLTGSWVRYTYTWSNLPSGVLNGISVNILCAGTGTFTMGITGVQLEVGSTATSFDYRPYGTELQLCQRYYQKSFDVGTAPANSVYSVVIPALSNYVDGWNTQFYIPFCVTMRATPSIAFFGGASGASPKWQTQKTDGTWGTILGSTYTVNTFTTGFSANNSDFNGSTGWQSVTAGTGRMARGDWTASAEL